MTQSIKHSVRAVAVQILTKVFDNAGYSNQLINQALKQQQFNDADQRLLSQLVYGVLQHKLTLDYELAPYLREKKLVPWVKNDLRVAVYQLKYLDRIPNHAILFEATQLAKVQGNLGLSKLVTAVLRNLLRNGWRSLADLAPLAQLAIQYSVPQWIIEQLQQQIGLDKTKNLLASLNQPPKLSLRVNSAKISREKLQQQLQAEGLAVEPSLISEDALVAEHGFGAGTKWFQQGFCTIQDESSMLVAPALRVELDSRILDACAAPGGKTTHLASLLGPSGQIVALDIHQKKLRLIQNNAQRLGVQQVIQTQALDARKAGQEFAAASFDRILVDAPCSGFGLMRRKPEIRYGRQLSDVLHLAQIQRDILTAVAPLLKVNGYLVYSTCTIFDQENQQVIEQFLATQPQFELVPVTTQKKLALSNQMLKIYPDDYQTDGFFIACLKRVK